MTEKGGMRISRAYLTLVCACWVAKQLRRVESEPAGGEEEPEQIKVKEVLRWRDHQAMAWGSTVANKSGVFWQLEVLLVSKLGRKVMLCIPVGQSGTEWQLACGPWLGIPLIPQLIRGSRAFTPQFPLILQGRTRMHSYGVRG